MWKKADVLLYCDIQGNHTLQSVDCGKSNVRLNLTYNIVKGVHIMSYVTGKTIKTLREKRKLTQKELAEKISVSDKTVSKWETGVSQS